MENLNGINRIISSRSNNFWFAGMLVFFLGIFLVGRLREPFSGKTSVGIEANGVLN